MIFDALGSVTLGSLPDPIEMVIREPLGYFFRRYIAPHGRKYLRSI